MTMMLVSEALIIIILQPFLIAERARKSNLVSASSWVLERRYSSVAGGLAGPFATIACIVSLLLKRFQSQ